MVSVVLHQIFPPVSQENGCRLTFTHILIIYAEHLNISRIALVHFLDEG